jgi:Protein of unknown function (DUF3450)
MQKRTLAAFAAGLLLSPLGLRGQGAPMQETRETLAKWVETKQLTSRTRADWQTDKETLEQTVALFERELKTLEENMGKLSTNNTQVEKERLQSETLKSTSQDSLERARLFAVTFEKELVPLLPRLPVPLQETVKPLLQRLPADPTQTRMPTTERIQVLVGILNEFDKFNHAVTLFSEKRKTPNGEEMAVETVYVGLGVAYFVNDSDNFAGTGTPGTAGWVWTVKPELASSVREIIRIYRNERPARFVTLPAVIR